MVIGFMIETAIGPIRMAILYFVIVIGGNIFGCLLSNKYALGSDVAIFGMIGGLLALIIVNWSKMKGQDQCCAVIMILFLVIVQIMLMVQAGQYGKAFAIVYSFEIADTWGAMGGFFSGLFSGLFIMPTEKEGNTGREASCSRVTKIIGIILTLIWFVLFFVLFFANKETE